MPDLASIAAILSSVKTATEIAKLLKDADLSLATAEQKLKLADLISSLADARIQVADVQELLNQKDAQIRELTKARDVHDKLKYEEPSYWLVEGDKREGPYCQCCYDKERKLVRVQGYETGVFNCMACGSTYSTREYRARQEAAIRRANDFDPYT